MTSVTGGMLLGALCPFQTGHEMACSQQLVGLGAATPSCDNRLKRLAPFAEKSVQPGNGIPRAAVTMGDRFARTER